jgi:LemA protein
MHGITGFLIAAVIILLAAVIIIFNGLVRKRNNAESAWSNIDVQLQRRYDLIPNLVETVKGYASHEKETFERIAELRTAFQNATSPKEFGQIENGMNKAVGKLFAVAENYPELKASQNFLMLQESLAGTENKIAYSRNNYNAAVMSFNTAIQTFPSTLIAGPFGFKKKEFFDIDDAAQREPVKADFSTKEPEQK